MNYFYTIKNGTPEHNIPEDKIVPIESLKIRQKRAKFFMGDLYYLCIDEDQLENIVKPNAVWPTEKYGYIDYNGAIIIRVQGTGDILTYVSRNSGELEDKFTGKKTKNNITLTPIYDIVKCGVKFEKHDRFPKRNVKVFLSKQELKDYQNKNTAKTLKKAEEDGKKMQEQLKQVPEFSFTTPKFRILEVTFKTDFVSVKEGDIIEGEIPVIGTAESGYPQGLLHGIGTRTNYVNIYINGNFERAISPLSFQNLFITNFKVERVNI